MNGSVLKNACNSEDGGWSNLLMSVLDGLHEILGGVIDARNEFSEALSVSGPLNNDFL